MTLFKKKQTSAAGKVGGALLAGLAAGAIVGILTAPQKGKKTQKDLLKILQGWFDELVESGKFKPEQYRQMIEDMINKYRDKFDLAEDVVIRLKDEFLKKLSGVKEEAKPKKKK